MIYNVIKYTMPCERILFLTEGMAEWQTRLASVPCERILFLTEGMAEWQTRLASVANVAREIGFDFRVNQI